MEFVLGLLRIVLLTLHLVTNALACGGPLLCVACRLFPRVRATCDDTLRRLAKWSLVALVVGLLAGAASTGLLWLQQDPSYREAAARFPRRAYEMLAAEWLFTAALYGVYLATWQKLKAWPWLHGGIGLLATTNLIYHFPTLMVVLGQLATEPGLTSEPEISRPVLLQLMLTPELLAKAAHFWALCMTVAGVTTCRLATTASATTASGKEPADGTASLPMMIGGGTALGGIGLTFLTGAWTLSQLAAGAQQALLGGDAVATAMLAVALASTLGLAHLLLPMATGEGNTRTSRRAWWLVWLIAGCMVVASHHATLAL